MNAKLMMGAVGVAGAIVALGQLSESGAKSPSASADNRAPVAHVTGVIDHARNGHVKDESPDAIPMQGGGGPDVRVSILGTGAGVSALTNYSDSSLGMRAYSVATVSCNSGTEPLEWFANTNRHPVIGQNLFRIAPGQNGHLRFEQLGQSWLKHGFFALDNDYGQCTGCTGWAGGNYLNVGCEDPYNAGRNAEQNSAGPKYEVNPTTGFFPYPPSSPSSPASNVRRRLQVAESDVLAANFPNAEFIIEGQYVHPQDAPAANWSASLNNVSYRRLTMGADGVATGFTGLTVQSQPAIHRWQVVDPQVTLTNVDVVNVGRMMVGSRAYDNGDGTWDYEYAVYNMHFGRSVGGVTIPLPNGAEVTAIGFHDVKYHSGEPFAYSGTDGHWVSTHADNTITFTTPQTFGQNTNGNAIRWGTVYNFRFTANVAPTMGDVTLKAFSPFPAGAPDSWSGEAQVPGDLKSTPCPADFDGSGTVDSSDLLQLLTAWGPGPGCPEDLDGDDEVNSSDLLILLAAWGDC
jgi:hypothetical protein